MWHLGPLMLDVNSLNEYILTEISAVFLVDGVTRPGTSMGNIQYSQGVKKNMLAQPKTHSKTGLYLNGHLNQDIRLNTSILKSILSVLSLYERAAV